MLTPLMASAEVNTPAYTDEEPSIGLHLNQISGLFNGESSFDVSLDELDEGECSQQAFDDVDHDFNADEPSNIEPRYELPSAMPQSMPVVEDDDLELPFSPPSDLRSPLVGVSASMVSGGDHLTPTPLQVHSPAQRQPWFKRPVALVFVAPLFLGLGLAASPAGRAYIMGLTSDDENVSPQRAPRPAPRPVPRPVKTTQPSPQPTLKVQASTQTKPQAQAKAQAEAQAKAQAEAQAEAQAKAQAEAQAKAQAEAQAQAKAQAKAQAEAQAQAKAQAEAQAQAKAQAETQAQSEVQTKAQGQAKAKASSASNGVTRYTPSTLSQLSKSAPYTLQVASFKLLSDANTLVDRLKGLEGVSANATPWILEIDLGRKGLRYRVLFGRFASKSDAREANKALKRAGSKGLVRPWTRWAR
jgi:cell division protein FtsN